MTAEERPTPDASSVLEIRRARPEDRDAVLAFCAHTWSDGDYIGEVWEEWQADEIGPLLVGVLDGRPVALEKISPTSADEVWLEGMRVDSAYRGRHIARTMFLYALEWARRYGARQVGLTTASNNLPIHHMVEAAGMHRVGGFAPLSATPLEGEVDAEQLAPETRAEAWSALKQWGTWGNLYCDDWAWVVLTPERLEKHARSGELWGVRGPDGRLQAVAMAQKTGENSVLLGFLDGEETGVSRLATEMRRLAYRLGVSEVDVVPEEHSPLLELLRTLEYQTTWAVVLWLYQCELEG